MLRSSLVKTLVRWPKIAPGGAPETYLRQVMLNDLRSRWRRRQRIFESARSAVPDRAAAGDVETDAAHRDMLAAALRQLAPGQRAVLYLRYYEDLSEADTARQLNCSTGTVKRQAHAGLARLRQIAPQLLPPAENSEVTA